MYDYEYDETTGGLRLVGQPLIISKEPRPVYSSEMNLLGFNRKWNYEPNSSSPYLWAEGRSYWYRGRRVATLSGGSLRNPPDIYFDESPEPRNRKLKPINMKKMIEQNREIIEAIRQEAIKRVYNTYVEYRDHIDLFYVAFSGGKDSLVTLDVVQNALPHSEFKVIFGDTGMEFSDTYDLVDEVEKNCVDAGIDFYRARSQFEPINTWRLFGTPATTLRWCCNVHKTIPQIMLLRNIIGKSNFRGMAFIGVRAAESASRSSYDYLSKGKKHRDQYSCNPILEWNSAEVYLYMYTYNLQINTAYKKGNKRVGCLVCPRATELHEYISRQCYPRAFGMFYRIINDLYKSSFPSHETWKGFIEKGGWKARRNGRDLTVKLGYTEMYDSVRNRQIIKVDNPRVDWKVWIKTIGTLVKDTSPYVIMHQNKEYEFSVFDDASGNGYTVSFQSDLAKKDPTFVRLIKNVFKKSACCIGCQECETDCLKGHLHMNNGIVEVDDDCIKCTRCHSVDKGCLIFKSLESPGGYQMSHEKKSLNCYSHFAPKHDWLVQFFKYKNEFASKHTLGSEMFSFFKRFLKDAGLLDNNTFSSFAEVVERHFNEDNAWALMLVNLAYTPQINWYIKRAPIGEIVERQYAFSRLVDDGAKQTWVADVWASIGRFVALPFGKVGLGEGVMNKRSLVSVKRTPWQNPDGRVILYGLYKFAEACGATDEGSKRVEIYRQFTLRRLLDFDVESDGVSPAEIFGLDRDTLARILTGLSANYPDFITTQFTHDLDLVTLNPERRSSDVLDLF